MPDDETPPNDDLPSHLLADANWRIRHQQTEINKKGRSEANLRRRLRETEAERDALKAAAAKPADPPPPEDDEGDHETIGEVLMLSLVEAGVPSREVRGVAEKLRSLPWEFAGDDDALTLDGVPAPEAIPHLVPLNLLPGKGGGGSGGGAPRPVKAVVPGANRGDRLPDEFESQAAFEKSRSREDVGVHARLQKGGGS